MKRAAVRLSVVIALVWCFSSTLQGQEFQEGTWSGTVVRMRGRNNNPQPQKVSIEFKKTPDPHRAWRPGKGEVWNITFIWQQGRAQVTDLRLEKESLSFSHRRGDIEMNCRLNRQADGAYQGECVGQEDASRFRITLTPPKS